MTTKDELRSKNVMTTQEAALYIGTSWRTMEKWRRIGKGPNFIRTEGGKIRYRRDVLDKYLLDLEVDPREEFEAKPA